MSARTSRLSFSICLTTCCGPTTVGIFRAKEGPQVAEENVAVGGRRNGAVVAWLRRCDPDKEKKGWCVHRQDRLCHVGQHSSA